MSKNPFQILDFLGYFFPGAIVMIALFCYEHGVQNLISGGTDTSAIIYVVCIIVAYIIGHIVSLLSSVTVEKYAIWKYGYPSEYLLNDYSPNRYLSSSLSLENRNISKNRRSCLRCMKIVLKLFVALFLLPVSVLDIVLSFLFGIDFYYTRKLPVRQINMIKGKCAILFKNIGIQSDPNNLFQGDNHRIVHNYYYENADKHSVRMENCIAIYDFLRAMTFVMCTISIIVLVKALSTINFDASIDWGLWAIIAVMAILSYVFYMGFLKFYRKFTIENFMCLICDKNLDFPPQKENILYTGTGVQTLSGNQVLTFDN